MPNTEIRIGDRVRIIEGGDIRAGDYAIGKTLTIHRTSEADNLNSGGSVRTPVGYVRRINLEVIGRGRCRGCRKTIRGEARGYSGSIYCADCFDRLFFTCSECRRIMPASYATEYDGHKVCENCLRTISLVSIDRAKVKPKAKDINKMAERLMAFSPAKKATDNTPEELFPLTGNADDDYIPAIIDRVGLVRSSFYVYGLKDRPEFAICAIGFTPEQVQALKAEIASVCQPERILLERGDGVVPKMGIARNLRLLGRDEVVKALKAVGMVKATEEASREDLGDVARQLVSVIEKAEGGKI